LPEDVRQNVINLFQDRLSDGLDLLLQTKQAHWNVKGTEFIALHKLFDRIHKELREQVDTIAERIVQLGGVAHGTSKVISKNSSLPEYPLTIFDWQDHVEFLSNSMGTYCSLIRKGIEQVSDWNDPVSEDILIQTSRSLDKNLWFVESHLFHKKSGESEMKEVA
jgi:starvation-inducible DNA-binding protein